MNRLLSFLALLAFLIVSRSSGATYYVDQTAGSDSAAGSQAAPWKNCPGMQGSAAHTGSHTLNAGDTVYLDRSDVWLVSASGDGGFKMSAGVTVIGNSYDPEGAGTGRAIIRANGRCEAGGIRFWQDHPTIQTVIEGVEYDGNNQVGSGVDFNHKYAQNALTGALKVVRNCYLHDMAGTQSSGDYKYGIIARGRIDSGVDHNVANVLIEGTEVYKPARDGILAYPDNTAGSYVDNMTVRGCTVHGIKNDAAYNEGHGIVAKADVRNMTIEYNYVHNVNSSGIFVFGENGASNGGPTNLKIRHNIVTCEDNPGGRGIIRIYETGTKSIEIYGNIIKQATVACAGIDLNANSGSLTLKVYNNTLFNTFIDFAGEGSGNSVECKNNLIVYSGTAIQQSTGVTLANNTSSTSSSGLGFVNYGSPPTGFTGTIGVDYAPSPNGLSLSSGTAVNAGANLGTSWNSTIVAGTTREGSGNWDNGAYDTGASGGGGGDVTSPTVQSASVGASGTTLTLSMSEATTIGSGGSGGLTLNITSGGAAVTASYASGAGSSSLVFNLSRTLVSGETLTRSYTQPGNGFEDAAGNDLASFSAQSVSNNSTQDGGAPTLSSATINTAGTTLTLVFNESVSLGGGGSAGWTVSLSGGGATVTYASGDGTATLVYTLSRLAYSGETGTVAYTQPGNGVEDIAGNDLATIASAALTNNSTQNAPTLPRVPFFFRTP